MKIGDVYIVKGVNKDDEWVFGYANANELIVNEQALSQIVSSFESRIHILEKEMKETKLLLMELLKSFVGGDKNEESN